MATPKDRYLRKSYTEGLDKVLKKAADADIEEARKETDMNIEKTGTFTIDLEPNWNEIMQLAIEMLQPPRESSTTAERKSAKEGGAEIVRGCVEAMVRKGGSLMVGRDANFLANQCGRRARRGGEVFVPTEDDGRSGLTTWAELAVEAVGARVVSANRLDHRDIEQDRKRAINFLKQIGQWWEADRQARRSKVEDGSVISKLEAGGSISLDELDATFVEVPLDES